MRLHVDVTMPGERSETRGARDNGKTFRITEMSADQGERWATRALLAASQGGQMLPSDVLSAGMLGVAMIGVRVLMGIPYVEAEPLMAEMFECVQIVEPSGPRRPTKDDIEEIATRVKLREEAFKLHTGFSIADELSKLMSAVKSQGSSNIEISPAPSESSSPPE